MTREEQQRLTREEQQRLFDLVANPPPRSKIAVAKRFGIDLTLNLRRLRLSPTERDEEMEAALQFVDELKEAASRSKT
jgi:hypothetical protein